MVISSELLHTYMCVHTYICMYVNPDNIKLVNYLCGVALKEPGVKPKPAVNLQSIPN